MKQNKRRKKIIIKGLKKDSIILKLKEFKKLVLNSFIGVFALIGFCFYLVAIFDIIKLIIK